MFDRPVVTGPIKLGELAKPDGFLAYQKMNRIIGGYADPVDKAMLL